MVVTINSYLYFIVSCDMSFFSSPCPFCFCRVVSLVYLLFFTNADCKTNVVRRFLNVYVEPSRYIHIFYHLRPKKKNQTEHYHFFHYDVQSLNGQSWAILVQSDGVFFRMSLEDSTAQFQSIPQRHYVSSEIKLLGFDGKVQKKKVFLFFFTDNNISYTKKETLTNR